MFTVALQGAGGQRAGRPAAPAGRGAGGLVGGWAAGGESSYRFPCGSTALIVWFHRPLFDLYEVLVHGCCWVRFHSSVTEEWNRTQQERGPLSSERGPESVGESSTENSPTLSKRGDPSIRERESENRRTAFSVPHGDSPWGFAACVFQTTHSESRVFPQVVLELDKLCPVRQLVVDWDIAGLPEAYVIEVPNPPEGEPRRSNSNLNLR